MYIAKKLVIISNGRILRIGFIISSIKVSIRIVIVFISIIKLLVSLIKKRIIVIKGFLVLRTRNKTILKLTIVLKS